VSSSRTETGAGEGSAATTVDVTMPQMGVSVSEGTIVAWRVSVGDTVAYEETVCDISTDKIDTELPSPAAGVVSEILVDVEETVAVGTVLARLSVGAEAAAPASDAPAGPSAGQNASAGAAASAGASASPAPEAAAQDPTGMEAAPTDMDTPAPPVPTSGPSSPSNGRRYSPVVQRIAEAHGIDLSQVAGTGRNGRVRKQDVMALVNGNGGGAASGGAVEEPPLHIESPYRPDPVAPAPASRGAAGDGGQLSRMRRTIGEHMKRSLEVSATCTTWIEVDMSRVEAARTKLGVTALSFVARACVLALREYPALNAWMDGERYSRFDGEVHLGIAVSLGEDGLIVPIVRDAHQLSVEGLAARIRDLAKRARGGQLSPDEVRGGTFTITNPGQYGSIMATPIINQPQVAILDLEAVVKRPVVVTDAEGNDSIAIRPMTILGLSWDHRALDGALSAQFLAAVKRNLETQQL
jgi:pyruvate/2-oxoglutarate dehydrogenase complex dihydrolipoamide acyltransferase (E2) component